MMPITSLPRPLSRRSPSRLRTGMILLASLLPFVSCQSRGDGAGNPTAPPPPETPLPADLSPSDLLGCWRSNRSCQMICFDRTGRYNAVSSDSTNVVEDSGSYTLSGFQAIARYERRQVGRTATNATDTFSFQAADTLLTRLDARGLATSELFGAVFPDSFRCATAWTLFREPEGWDTLITPSGLQNTSIVPPVINMLFPQPWEVISEPSEFLDFEISSLYYPGMRFGPRSGYLVAPGDGAGLSFDTATFLPFPDTTPVSNTRIHLRVPLAGSLGKNPADGPFVLVIRVETYVGTYLPRRASIGVRKIPFHLDRSAPALMLSTSLRRTADGDTATLRISWKDEQKGLEPGLRMARFQVRDTRGALVHEPEPGISMFGSNHGRLWSLDRVPDGSYTFHAEACDYSVPDASTRSAALTMQGAFRDAMPTWTGRWSDSLSQAWDRLRLTPGINWSSAATTFRVDRTPPSVQPEPLPTMPVGLRDLCRLRFRIADAGSTTASDTVRMRATFIPRGETTKHHPVWTLDTVLTSLPDSLGSSPVFSFGESEATRGRFPEGQWSVLLRWQDQPGNADSLALSGILELDRTPPEVSILFFPRYTLDSGIVPTGEISFVSTNAVRATLTWSASDGTRLETPMALASDGKTWHVPYPAAILSRPGSWKCDIAAFDQAGNGNYSSTTVRVN